MSFCVTFKGKGHPNIRSTHRTTFMTTKEPELSTRGDCIIAVGVTMALRDMPDDAKELAKSEDTMITFKLSVDELVFEAKGRGHSNLEYTDPVDMVARKSNYTCGRTLMVSSDMTSKDIPVDVVEALKSPDSNVEIEITYSTTPE